MCKFCLASVSLPFLTAYIQGFDALLASLDIRGVRESYLHTMLQKIEIFFKKAVRKKMLHTNTGKNKDVKTENVAVTHHPDCNIGIDSPVSTVCFANSQMSETSTSFVIELGRNENESGRALKRYRDLERWIWKECFSSPMIFAVKNGKKRCKQLLDACDDCHGTYSLGENHCPYCLQNYDNLENHIRFSDHVVQCKEEIKDQHFSAKGSHALPLRIRLVKLLLALIEVSTIGVIGQLLYLIMLLYIFKNQSWILMVFSIRRLRFLYL